MSRKSHGVEEALLGFDARERFLEAGSLWAPERRGIYLLREDVQKPLSVDPLVWPSLFGEGLPDAERTRLGLEAMSLPGWRGPNQGLWDSLSRMRSALGPLASEAHGMVAVSWVSADGSPLMLNTWHRIGMAIAKLSPIICTHS